MVPLNQKIMEKGKYIFIYEVFNMIIVLLIIFLGVVLFSIRQIDEFERGILFRFGKFAKILSPGWHVVYPIIHSYRKIDIRTKAVDVPEQEAITRDNVSIKINAVLYYKILYIYYNSMINVFAKLCNVVKCGLLMY